MSLIATDQLRVIIGLGQTGLSCARYLARQGLPFVLVDTRDVPPNLEQIKTEFPAAELHCGELDVGLLSRASEILLSPGVAKDQPAIQQAVAAGVKLSGDIDLFCQAVSAPIVAITGSNAKSTVTTLVGQMALNAGIDTGIGGNLGTPVLDMLAAGEQDLYVLELSSFQLETVNDLRASVATVLNVSPDHLDRYDNNMQLYYQAKHRIFRGSAQIVINRDDSLTSPLVNKQVKVSSFGLSRPDLNQFGLLEKNAEQYLVKGLDPLLRIDELKTQGQHNIANALAALALGDAVNIPMAAMLQTLKTFTGLKHRCQWIAEKQGVTFFNDSKGTNVGATVAAIDGLAATLADNSKILLIAGGVGKGAEFSDLNKPLQTAGRALILIGEDGPVIDDAVNCFKGHYADSMSEAVKLAADMAQSGDIVLLSPACASFDMFSGFPARGDAFIEAVEAL
ncbi:UDP-N-acetylmuramoyl-L-alanine--D-glutamate ligase [Amphritea balenae]|uniref:UDP-N-acetylmuramoylalanine--D-glutamate ligase n=1 Tax=Amphritea balenae TaxID=452629 RepID=A0A3P1SSG2_9GAMM|nr:UDP-N-acetylmuramoyl-L-alanine--D-glutamate ligase [Amphritea balenae]RRD00129.1 UDP-N-acetylmuramoyl-L-alanine--D-glutamate ligase [Amphritea balenae]GGK76907.1 UDP-N-acetylmuramoylalanine--D-glutamate ligase [Amphritea balenae]